MFANLYAEMKKRKITQVKLSAYLGITNRAFNMKIKGGNFTSDEMFAIKEKFFPDKSLEYLFKKK